MSETTWHQLQDEAEAELRRAGIESSEAEARWILDAVGRTDGDASESPTVLVERRVHDMLTRRAAGEPLQYVLGEWQFRAVDVFVDRRVLIPRPETEVTAQAAIDAAVARGARRGRSNTLKAAFTAGDAELVMVDLGTGSGAIALALADELPDAEVWATDASEDALAVTRANLAGAGASSTRIRVAQGDWFEALPEHLLGKVRVVVSNPPYISEAEVNELPAEVIDHEPRGALVSGPTGLECIERIVTESPSWLEPGGALVVEIAPAQSATVMAMAHAAGFSEVTIRRDLTDRDRVLVAHVASS